MDKTLNIERSSPKFGVKSRPIRRTTLVVQLSTIIVKRRQQVWKSLRGMDAQIILNTRMDSRENSSIIRKKRIPTNGNIVFFFVLYNFANLERW